MKKYTIAVLFTFFLFTGMNLMAQTISGVITDDETGEPLIGATIKIKDTNLGTATALDGSFSIEAKKVGEQVLVVSYVGYIENELDIDVKSGNNDLGSMSLESNSIGLQAVKITASFVQDRQTPISVSTVKPIDIEEKMGAKELPEVLETTPSVYATKRGGGFGDSRISLRGFDSDNIGVLINGIPINDMESGKVYWSNWSSLPNIVRAIQVQRGLGASKLALSSVGGTVNIVTNSTDAKKGGQVTIGTGNDSYTKRAFAVSTGMQDNGWAMTLSGSLTTSDGYANALNYRAYSYFMNISKKINDEHFISFTAFGAPQWHNQRNSYHYADVWRNNKDGVRLNTDYGIRNGEIYNGNYAYNEYHKPQISFNHNWKIDKKSNLSTTLYASISDGGGRRISGEMDQWLEFEYPSGEPYDITKLTPEGLLDYDAVIEENQASLTGSKAIVSMSVNRHDWYGILSNYSTELEKLTLSAGIDGRYYKAYHYTEITDLLGGDYFIDTYNVNRDDNTPLKEGDKISYYNTGEVAWGGLYGQAEYVDDNYSAFINLAGSSTMYRRKDFFTYENGSPDQVSDWLDFLSYSAKGGANWKINSMHNVFGNIGYFTRAPWFRYAFVGYTNEVNEGAKYEKIFSTELGYGFNSPNISLKVTAYRTQWIDKALTRSFSDYTANLTGLNALHQGVEAELFANPTDKLSINAMVSVGDYNWTDDLVAEIYDENQQYVGTANVYAKDLKVGDAAQTTASLAVGYKLFKDFKIGFTFKHWAEIYSQFDIEDRTTETEEIEQAWKIPDVDLIDARFSYDFKIGDYKAKLIGNVDNILDTEYISDAIDGENHDISTSPVYYGFGRTWRATVKLYF